MASRKTKPQRKRKCGFWNGHGKWVRVGPRHLHQYRCSRCGMVKHRKPLFTFHTHRYKLNRRYKPPRLMCKCGKTLQTGRR